MKQNESGNKGFRIFLDLVMKLKGALFKNYAKEVKICWITNYCEAEENEGERERDWSRHLVAHHNEVPAVGGVRGAPSPQCTHPHKRIPGR